MFEIVKLLFEICLFKKSPKDLPRSLFLLQLLTVANIVISFLLLHIRSDWFSSLLQSVVGILLAGIFCGFILFIYRKIPRFYQTACALLGTDTLIGFFALPAGATLVTGQGSLLVFLAMLGLIAWHWAIIGHIIRHALEQSLSFSLGLALLYLLGSYQVIALLFPDVVVIN